MILKESASDKAICTIDLSKDHLENSQHKKESIKKSLQGSTQNTSNNASYTSNSASGGKKTVGFRKSMGMNKTNSQPDPR